MKVKRLFKSFNAFIKSLLFNIKVIIRHIRFNWIYKGMLALRPYQRLTRIKSSRLKKSFKAKLGILSAKIKGIKRPRWFQWNIFPKDGNPPTQSLFEITIYIVVLVICFKIFVCFNRIPQNYLTFEVEKIPYLDDNPQKNNLINYITKSMYDDTTFYLHYQIAEINLLLPMLNVKNDSIKQGCWVGEIYSDSMKVSCSLNNDRIKLNTYLDNYWHVVFSQAENYHKQVNDYLFSDSLYTNEFVSIFYKYIFLPEFGYMYNGEKQMLADKIAPQLRNRYYLSICSSIMKNPLMNKFNKNTTWKEIDRKLIYANKESNRKNFGRWRTELKKGIEYISFDLLGVSEKSKYYPGEKIVLLEDYGTKIVGAEVPNKEHFKLSLSSNSNLFKYTSTELPGWFDLNDISQASYIINLKATSIDSINLVIDFVGATDFYTTSIEPDEISGHSIKFTDQKKLLQIKTEGLKFYAKFKELENMQMIRTFAITAIISGLVIIILTFLILGLYRSYKVLHGSQKG